MITLRLLTCLLATFLGVASSPAASIWQQATPYAVNTNSTYAPLGSVNHISYYGAPFNDTLPGQDKIYVFELSEPMFFNFFSPLHTRIRLLADSSADNDGSDGMTTVYVPAGRHYLVLEQDGPTDPGPVTFLITASTGPRGNPATYYTNSGTLACGQTLVFPAACEGVGELFYYAPRVPFRYYWTAPISSSGIPFGCSRAFKFTLAQASYIQARLRTDQYDDAFMAISADSSNISVIEFGWQPLQDSLPAGTYWLIVARWPDTQQSLPDMPVELLCSPTPIPRYQSAKPLADSLAAGNIMQGDLIGREDRLYTYYTYVKEIIYHSDNMYEPGVERVFKYQANKPQKLSLLNHNHSVHKVIVLDSTGSTQLPMYVGGILTGFSGQLSAAISGSQVMQASTTILPEAGTYYIIVEQNKNAVNDAFDYKLVGTCLPTVYSATAYTYSIGLNSFESYSSANHAGGYADDFYCSNYVDGAFTLHVGERNYLHTRHTQPGLYDRLYADFNDDGDFDDAGELIYAATGSHLDTSVMFSLSRANRGYVAANGKLIRLRLLSVLTPAMRGPCGDYGEGSAIDILAIVSVSPPYAAGGDYAWVRLAEGWGNDYYSKVRSAPDGSMYGALNYESVYNTNNGQRWWSQVKVYGTPGAAGQLKTSGGVWESPRRIDTRAALVKYGKDGMLKWVAGVKGYSDASTNNALVITGLAVDRLGYIYACGSLDGDTLVVEPAAGAPARLICPRHGFSFVLKLHPDGHVIFVHPVYADSAFNLSLSGIDVDAGLRYYLSGSFTGRATLASVSGTTTTLVSRGLYDGFLAGFSGQGSLSWVVQVGGAGNDDIGAMAADKAGGAYATGGYHGTATFSSTQPGSTPIIRTAPGADEGFLLSADANGGLRWITPLAGSIYDLAADPRGTGAVAVGSFADTATFGSTTLTSAGQSDAFAVRISSAGSVQWATQAGSPQYDYAGSVRLDHTGNPWVAFSFFQDIGSAFGGRPMAAGSAGWTCAFVRLHAADGILRASDPASLLNNDVGYYNGLTLDTVDGGGAALGGSFSGDNRNSAGNFCDFGRLGRITSVDYNPAYYSSYEGTTAFMARFSSNLPSQVLKPYKADNRTRRQGEEEVLVGLKAYPNPSSGIVSIRLTGLDVGFYPVSVLNAKGIQVFSATLEASQLSQGLALNAHLAPGLYLIAIAGRRCRVVVR